MLILEEIITKYGHPIIKNRITQLSKLLNDFLLNKQLDITCFNIFSNGKEIILDHDDFQYKIYFLNYKEMFLNKDKSSNSDQFDLDYKSFLYNVQRILNKDFTLIIEVYNKHIRQLWNDGYQLIEYYKNLIDINVDIFHDDKNTADYLKIEIPSKLILEMNLNSDKIKNNKYFAFEMLSSAIRNCLYSGSILNTIRYITYFNFDEEITKDEEYQIENYFLVDLSEFSNKKLLAFYPKLSMKNPQVILALEFKGFFITQNIITNNFLQELSIAINKYGDQVKKQAYEKISIFLSNSLPKNIEEISNDKKLDQISKEKSFLILFIPLSWLKTTNDSLKLFLAAFISIISDILHNIIPQCKCTIRCGLRKHVLELTNQEYEGY